MTSDSMWLLFFDVKIIRWFVFLIKWYSILWTEPHICCNHRFISVTNSLSRLDGYWKQMTVYAFGSVSPLFADDYCPLFLILILLFTIYRYNASLQRALQIRYTVSVLAKDLPYLQNSNNFRRHSLKTFNLPFYFTFSKFNSATFLHRRQTICIMYKHCQKSKATSSTSIAYLFFQFIWFRRRKTDSAFSI